MTRDARFWRNVTIIGLLHLLVLLGLLWWSRTPKHAPNDVVWMEGGIGATGSESAAPAPAVTPELTKQEATPEVAPSLKSEIELPSSTASVTRTPTPTPTPTATPTPNSTPKPTPKVTPKPKLSAIPKKKSTPKPKPTPDEEKETTAKELAKKKAIAKAALAKEKEDEGDQESSAKPAKKATAARGEESGEKSSGGSGGHSSGEGGASQFGWYGNMLHDRFYSEWVQPTTVVASGAKISVVVRIRIQKDGRVSDFEIVRPSGNVVVDESVQAVAARVKQVDPLPSGLGDDYYDVKINFEFNAGQ